MGVIKRLDKSVAELIAAGEVVERPASVAKEMIENAIDAGAKKITVELKNGGMTFLRITDNGCGFFPEDVPLAFLRHATSKVKTAEDLESIRTMGFRGEALASVAAVAKVELFTRRRGQLSGICYRIEGGEEQENTEAGCPEGTTILVRDLFYNTPARLKFLKKDVSEANAVAGAVEKLALAYPDIAFCLIRDGQRRLSTPGDGKLLSAVYSVYGREFAVGLIPVDYTLRGHRVQGLISLPHSSRANRSMQTFYVNSRYIKARICTAALEEGYKHDIMAGKFPACVLDLSVSPEQVDVNVHPAKIEVRFQNEKDIFDLIYFGVRSALSTRDQPVEAKLKAPLHASISEVRQVLPVQHPPSVQKDGDPFDFNAPLVLTGRSTESDSFLCAPGDTLSGGEEYSFSEERQPYFSGMQGAPSAVFRRKIDIEVEEEPLQPNRAMLRSALDESQRQTDELEESPRQEVGCSGPFQNPRYLGEVFKTYILLEDGENLIAVDKHAAHERVLFNRLKGGIAQEDCQQLLVPVSVSLSREEYDAALSHRDILQRCGFETEDFGESLLVRSAPMWLEAGEAASTVGEICAALCEGREDITPAKLDWLYHNIACRSAVKGGDRSSSEELEEIVRLLREDPSIRRCPHGRPVCIVLTKRELEKQFGRS